MRARSFGRSVFQWWRSSLVGVALAFRGPSTGIRRPFLPAAVSDIRRYLASPGRSIADFAEGSLSTVTRSGIAALVFGVAVASVLGPLRGASVTSVLLAAIATPAWAFVRLLIIRAAATPRRGIRHEALTAAWGGSLLPYALGFTSALRIGSFVLSTWLAYAGLRGTCEGSSREAARLVAWSYGGQAAVAVLAWILRSLMVFVLYLGAR